MNQNKTMHLCVTRFCNSTFNENKDWKLRNNKIGCIYGTPIKITDTILPEAFIIVIEMNNEKNIIEGIGFIKNKLVKENKKKFKIYSDNNYNRFIYQSNMRIDKNSLINKEKDILKNLEDLLFKSRKHSKRGQGIQCVPGFINEKFDYNKFFSDLYNDRFIKFNIDKYKLKIVTN